MAKHRTHSLAFKHQIVQEYEARIAALERLVGKHALCSSSSQGGRRPRSAPMSFITAPKAGAQAMNRTAIRSCMSRTRGPVVWPLRFDTKMVGLTGICRDIVG